MGILGSKQFLSRLRGIETFSAALRFVALSPELPSFGDRHAAEKSVGPDLRCSAADATPPTSAARIMP